MAPIPPNTSSDLHQPLASASLFVAFAIAASTQAMHPAHLVASSSASFCCPRWPPNTSSDLHWPTTGASLLSACSSAPSCPPTSQIFTHLVARSSASSCPRPIPSMYLHQPLASACLFVAAAHHRPPRRQPARPRRRPIPMDFHQQLAPPFVAAAHPRTLLLILRSYAATA